MLNQEERAAKFFDAITKDAEDRHEELTRRKQDTVDAGLEKARKRAYAQAQARIEHERTACEQDFNRTVAKQRTEQRARLTAQRSEITDGVFAAAREKLVEFTATQEYSEFIRNSAARLAQVFDQGEVTVFVRECDLHFADMIKSAFGRACDIESSDEIEIGGCRARLRDGGIVADDTLDKRLEAQREWFLENSGMKVIL